MHKLFKPVALLMLLSLFLFGCSSQPKQAPLPPEPETVVEETTLEKVERMYGPQAAARVKYWQELIDSAPRLDERDKLSQVNQFFNGARFLDDSEVWGETNYWATPLEFLILDAGDCEDFACAKYFTLLEMGVEIDKLRLIHCKASSLDNAHMVLAYYLTPDAMPLILDNLKDGILAADQRLDLTPVYSFNGKDLWLAKSRFQYEKAGDIKTQKRWQALQERVKSGEVPVLVIKD